MTAEARVHAAIRAALEDAYRLYSNVRWIARSGQDGPARDGETDLVIVHPDDGLLVMETKGGLIRRDGQGRWWSGEHALSTPPFRQAEVSKHALVRLLADLPDWPGREADIRAGHAVAFPDVDLATVAHPGHDLGPDAPSELVLDGSKLTSPAAVRAWVERAYGYWNGDGRRGRAFSAAELALIEERLSPPPLELGPALRRRVDEGEPQVVTLTRGQYHVLDTLRRQRRAAVCGPAGCGKTMLAAEKARRLAKDGFRTLLVYFNQPLARELASQLADAPAPGCLDVSTFHELCRRLGHAHGLLPMPEPDPKPSDWFDALLPAALEGAIAADGARYHAVVVDEGQDFERSWLESLDLMLTEPGEGVLYIFHDPGQALFREDAVASLGLPEYDIAWNCRNPRPIHALAARHAPGLEGVEVLREDGPEPEVIVAGPGRATVEALRRVLHRLVLGEHVRPWELVVLSGSKLADSAVWAQRRFGDQVLWNGSYDDAGRSLGLSADAVPEQPSDTILCESIRRFKGLESPVVVLVELDPADARLQQLLYVGATRAREHLVVITPETL